MKNVLNKRPRTAQDHIQYQVVYCDCEFWEKESHLATQVEQTFRWYLLACPVINIKSLFTARRRARKLKSKYGLRAQVIIMAKVKGQFKTYAADYISGIAVLRGEGAIQCKDPRRIFTKNGTKPVLYPDFSRLIEGIMLLKVTNPFSR